jgi:hypothetical protein
VLGAEAAASMLATQFAHAPGLPGWTFGFYELRPAAPRALVAGGELPGFSSRILLLPEHGIGLFVAVNRKDASLATSLFDGVLARFPRATAGTPAPPAPPARLLGAYRLNMSDRSSYLRIAELFAPTATVEAADDTTVVVRFTGIARPTRRLRRIAPLLYEEPGSGHRIGFRARDGAVTHLFTLAAEAGPVAFERVAPHRTAGVVATLALVPAGAFAMALVALPLSALLRRRAARRGAAGRPGGPRVLAALVAITGLAFLVGFAAAIARLAVLRDDRFAFEAPAWLVALLLLPLVHVALAGLLAWRVARLARAADRSAAALAPYGALVLAAALLAVWLWRWNLITPHL